MGDEELHSLQLDKPSGWGKSNDQLAKHTVDSQFESKPIERSLHLLSVSCRVNPTRPIYLRTMSLHLHNIHQHPLENDYLLLEELYTKGDDVQKLSVIQALPQLLQYDANGTLTRLVPKIQQELPKSSCEFHIATSKIFKLLIEKQLPLNLIGAVIQGTESKDPVVSNAWIETLLSVITILPIDQIKTSVVPLALAKSQPTSPVYCRVASCKIFGKCASHPQMKNIDVKSSILPAVQSLCQDCFQDVRATMCANLHFIAQGLGETLVKTSLLPSLVELASDDNMSVRSAAVAAAVLIIPYLNKETKIDTIVPLIKQLCSKASGPGDTTFPTISREFGKLVQALQNDLEVADSVWILQFFKTLATKGQAVRLNKDNLEVTQDVLCREQCAFNLPAVTVFTVARIPNQLELWRSIFSGLANDSCYIVRKTTAACVFEIAKTLGPQCKIIKDDLIKLLRDDAEEVLQMLVPHVGGTLELLCTHGVLSRESNLPSCLEITRALLKCQLELAKTYNWRIKTNFLQELERLPNCMPSDFIHQHFTPVILNCVLEARPKPVKSQACRTLLVLLRYNLKEVQRKWIRDNLISHLCYAKSCYTRHIFVLACRHASEVFSNSYFKKFFFEPLLTLADDPVSNVRISVIGLLPIIYRMLVLPDDKKLQTNVDNIFSKMDMTEKDKDVKDILRVKLKEVRTLGANKPDYLADQKRKEEEENRILQGKMTAAPMGGAATQGKSALSARANTTKDPVNVTRSQPIIGKSPSSGSAGMASKSPSMSSGPSDMSFLEQHFYIDAGVSLPSNNIAISLKPAKNLDDPSFIQNEENIDPSATTVENVNIEMMLESELAKLETSTTNITDDVKVNLRKRTKKGGKTGVPKSVANVPKENSCANFNYKRYSSVFPTTRSDSTSSKVFNRRSLNIGGGDASRIPVCIKKSQSNTEIKNESKSNADNSQNGLKKSNVKSRIRPKSEILAGSNGDKRVPVMEISDQSSGDSIDAINSSISENSVPIKNSISGKPSKTSGLPVPKRRTASDSRK